MRSIAVMNQKGGVGKTTTAVNLAAALARDGRSVLLLDLDPQAHATLHVGVELSPTQPALYDVLAGSAAIAETARTVAPNLVLVPASADLVSADLELAGREHRETVLRRAIEPYLGGFDFCIVDCGPSLGLLTVNALTAVQEVLIPLQPHFLALQGLGRLLETVTVVRDTVNANLRVSGVVLCAYERGTRLGQEVAQDVASFLAAADPGTAWHRARLLQTVIRRNIKLAECPSFGQTIFQYAPDSHGAEDYAALAAEVLALREPAPAGEPDRRDAGDRPPEPETQPPPAVAAHG